MEGLFALIISIFAVFASVYLSFFLRRKDKRNTQLNVLKNFINTSVNNMDQIFHEKQKEFKDKTIGLDISLKKLDKASEFINKKLHSIQGFITQSESLNRDMVGSLREARDFETELSRVKEQIKEIQSVHKDVDSLKKSISDIHKDKDVIRKDLEQTRIWAQDNIGEFVSKSETSIKSFENSIIKEKMEDQAALEKKISQQIDDMQFQSAKMEELQQDIEEQIASTQTEHIEKADQIKKDLQANLLLFEDKWKHTIENFEELNKKMSTSVVRMDKQMKVDEEDIKSKFKNIEGGLLDKLNDFEGEMSRILQDKSGHFDQEFVLLQKKVEAKADNIATEIEASLQAKQSSVSDELEQKMKYIENQTQAIVLDFEGRKSNLLTRFEELSGGLEQQFQGVEDEYQGKLNTMETRFNRVTTEIEQAESRIEKEASELFQRANQEMNHVVDELKKTMEQTMKEKLETVDDRWNDQLKKVESSVNDNIRTYNEKLGQTTRSINDINHKLSNFVKEQTKNFSDEVYALKNNFTSDAERVMQKIELYGDQLKELEDRAGAHKQSVMQDIRESLNAFKQESMDDLNRVREEVESVKLRTDGAMVDIDDKIDTIREKAQSTENKVKLEIDELVGSVKTHTDGALEGIDDKIGSIRDKVLSTENKVKQELDKLEVSIKDIQNNADSNLEIVKGKYDDMVDLLEGLEQQIDNAKPGIEQSLKEYFEELKNDSKKLMRQKLGENDETIQEFFTDQKTAFRKEVQTFKEAFIPPREEIIKRMQDEKKKFSDQVNEYVQSSKMEFGDLTNRIEEVREILKNTEKQSLSDLKKNGALMETEITERLTAASHDFDAYVRKSEEDFYQEMDKAKSEMKELFKDLKETRSETREGAMKDIKDITKYGRDIENRLDQFLKKAAVLERAENLAERSDKNIETISEYLKDLEVRKRDLEATLKSLDSIRGESKAVQSMLGEMVQNKHEAERLQEVLTDTLEKARDTQSLLDVIQEQQIKAEETKGVLMETLKMYEDIRGKVEELDKKKKMINGILESVDTASGTLGNITDTMNSLEDRISMMNKETRRVDDEIRAARNTINNLFEEQDKVSSAVSKISDMESLLYHIEEESKKIERMRDWVAAMQTELERIQESQEDMLPGAKKAGGRKKTVDEETTKNVIRLREQDWNVSDIAKSLKISRAYVELILERYES